MLLSVDLLLCTVYHNMSIQIMVPISLVQTKNCQFSENYHVLQLHKMLYITCHSQRVSSGTSFPAERHTLGAVVKVMKTLLKKVVGSHILRTDEFQTLLFKASAVMNSCPLVPVDSQPAYGIEPLTPGHFLHDSGPTSLPHDTTATLTTTYGKRWRLNQYLANELWTRWKKEYLVLLQRRNKWRDKTENLAKGDIIILKDIDLFQRS